MAIDTLGKVTEETIAVEGDSKLTHIRGVDSEEPVHKEVWVCLVGSQMFDLT